MYDSFNLVPVPLPPNTRPGASYDQPQSLRSAIRSCSSCSGRSHCAAPVPGFGPSHSAIMVIGEAPGRDEDRYGIPFIGQAGTELTNYLRLVGIHVDDIYKTNTVKCWTGQGDPTPPDSRVASCSHWLDAEIAQIRPSIIVAAGVSALTYLGNMGSLLHNQSSPMEESRGIPFYLDIPFLDYHPVCLPIYHPAAAMRDTALMSLIQRDFYTLRLLLAGVPPEDINLVDLHPNVLYSRVGSDFHIPSDISVLAVDTETYPDGSLYCLSFSFSLGVAYIILRADVRPDLFLNLSPSLHLVFHNAAFDLSVLRNAGVIIPSSATVDDTMVAAYILREHSLGLKHLARRRLGMEMLDYSDVVSPYQNKLSLEYLASILQVAATLPIPEPVSYSAWDKVSASYITKVRHPQPLSRKVKRIIADSLANKCSPFERWESIDHIERAPVESSLGPMPTASLEHVDPPAAIHYSARDADATFRLFFALYPDLLSQGLLPVYRDVDLPILPMVASMQESGLPVDRGKLASLRTVFESRKDTAMTSAWVNAGAVFNPGSPPQVSELLFKKLNLPPSARTSGGADSTADKVLHQLQHSYPDFPVISDILEFRRVSKMIDSFISPLDTLGSMGPFGYRVHCDLRTVRTATGRMAAASPNLMAMPVRFDEGKAVRSCFVSRPGYTFLSADLSQIEMRLMAHRSLDAALISAFHSGVDVHSHTAAQMFHIPLSDVDPQRHRYPAKRVGFGVMYGISDLGLYQQLVDEVPDGDWTVEGSQRFIDMYFESHPGVYEYIQETRALARRLGYVTDIFGRRRDIPEVYSALPRIVEAGLRQAVNATIQMSAAGVIKCHMREIWRLLIDLGLGPESSGGDGSVFPLLQIHDDLLFEVRESMLPLVAPLIVSVMEMSVQLSVPVKAEAKVGTVWGDMHIWEG